MSVKGGGIVVCPLGAHQSGVETSPHAAGEREGRRVKAEREVQGEEGLRFLEYWQHENPRDCI